METSELSSEAYRLFVTLESRVRELEDRFNGLSKAMREVTGRAVPGSNIELAKLKANMASLYDRIQELEEKVLPGPELGLLTLYDVIPNERYERCWQKAQKATALGIPLKNMSHEDLLVFVAYLHECETFWWGMEE